MDLIRKLQKYKPSPDTLKKMFRSETPHAEDKFKLERALRAPDLKPKDRKIIEATLAGGVMDKSRQVIDPVWQKKAEEEVDRQIRAAIRRGDLPKYDPKKDAQGERLRAKAATKKAPYEIR